MIVHRCGDLHIEYDEGGLMVRRPDGAQGQIELTWEEVYSLNALLTILVYEREFTPSKGEL